MSRSTAVVATATRIAEDVLFPNSLATDRSELVSADLLDQLAAGADPRHNGAERVTALLASLRDQLRSQPGVAEVYLTPVTATDPRSQDRGTPVIPPRTAAPP